MRQANRHLTLETLAQARGLDPALLRRLGWTERPDGSVAIPWQRSDGQMAWHIRLTLEREDGRKRWVWSGFDRASLLPYLGQYLPAWRAKGHRAVVITESESDAVALASAGLAAIATGGADSWQDRWWSLLQGFDRVIVWLEDGGSLPLLRALLESRPADGPTVYVAHNIGGPKDPGRILAASNGDGRAILHRRIEAAVPVEQTADLLSTVIGRLKAEKRPNGSYSARCPFHADRHPSLSIFKGDDGRWAFRCHSGRCGVGGPLGLLGAVLGLLEGPTGSLPPVRPDSSVRPERDSSGGRTEFRFLSPTELRAQTAEAIPWIWEGYLAQGALTVLGAREKTGKSTLAFALLRHLLDGSPFLGRPTTPTAIVYISEEAPATLQEKLERFGLSGEDERLRLLPRQPTRPGLAALMPAAVAEAQRVGARLLVVDTLSWWANLPPEAENDAGAVQQALEPLLAATAQGLAVLVLHHTTKTSGELRGSTALGAAADIILMLKREPEAPTRRRLDGVGRFQATPESVLIELQEDQYVLLGTPATVESEQRERQVLAVLGEEPLTQAEIAEAAGLPKQRVAEVLGRLVASGQVMRSGRGGKSDPYRYALRPLGPSDDDPDGPGTPRGQVAVPQDSSGIRPEDSSAGRIFFRTNG
jgi:hypothetical protein